MAPYCGFTSNNPIQVYRRTEGIISGFNDYDNRIALLPDCFKS